ncbi:MAG TPA: leucyl/phenylalanyl-tRNA--protein transferase [Nitrospiria bacterium]
MIPPELLEKAYREGIFPMADAEGTIRWFSPDPRTIIPLDNFHISRSLERTIRREKFRLTLNSDFEGVMRGCADRPETWINEAIIEAYTALFRMGKAVSVEAHLDKQLVGGIYGVSLGGGFMGESMFSRTRDASKVCLAYLLRRLAEKGYVLFDTQFQTPHLKRFGAVEIPREEYLKRLKQALGLNCRLV